MRFMRRGTQRPGSRRDEARQEARAAEQNAPRGRDGRVRGDLSGRGANAPREPREPREPPVQEPLPGPQPRQRRDLEEFVRWFARMANDNRYLKLIIRSPLCTNLLRLYHLGSVPDAPGMWPCRWPF